MHMFCVVPTVTANFFHKDLNPKIILALALYSAVLWLYAAGARALEGYIMDAAAEDDAESEKSKSEADEESESSNENAHIKVTQADKRAKACPVAAATNALGITSFYTYFMALKSVAFLEDAFMNDFVALLPRGIAQKVVHRRVLHRRLPKGIAPKVANNYLTKEDDGKKMYIRIYSDVDVSV
nr:hypothetical protein [Tanacetum cinerariifolium]